MKLALLVAAVLSLPTVAHADGAYPTAGADSPSTGCGQAAGCVAIAYADVLATHDSRVAVPQLIVFDPGRLRIRAPARWEIREVARSWQRTPSWGLITVVGYSGAPGQSPAKNLELATRRAQQVRRYLIRYGVAPEFVVAVSRAGAAPADAHLVGRRVDLAIEACDPMLLACRTRRAAH